jgi:hypothetical protein
MELSTNRGYREATKPNAQDYQYTTAINGNTYA